MLVASVHPLPKGSGSSSKMCDLGGGKQVTGTPPDLEPGWASGAGKTSETHRYLCIIRRQRSSVMAGDRKPLSLSLPTVELAPP